MGGWCSRTCPALFGDQTEIPPKLRPPSYFGVLASLLITFYFTLWMVAFRMGMQTFFFCFCLFLLFGVLGTGEGSAWERKYPSMIFLVPIALLSAIVPVYIGAKIYVKIYAPYELAISGRHYENVAPTADTAEYADGGIYRFTEDATLDTSRSFGFKAPDFTYCVAPVVSRNANVHPHSSGPKVSFWAVGKDCCGVRRDFECDGAGETEVRSAFAFRDIEHDFLSRLLVPRTSRPQYLKAVDAAKALHELKSQNDENIILVRWAADPEKTLEVWRIRALIACSTSCILYTVLIIALWTIISLQFDQNIRSMAKQAYARYVGGFDGSRPGSATQDLAYSQGAGVP